MYNSTTYYYMDFLIDYYYLIFPFFLSQFWRRLMRTICWNNLKKCHQISMMIIAKIVLLVATFLQQLLPIMSKMAPETEAVKILGKLPTFSRLCKTTLLLRWQQIMKAIRPTVDADVYQESVSLPIIYCILTLCTMG